MQSGGTLWSLRGKADCACKRSESYNPGMPGAQVDHIHFADPATKITTLSNGHPAERDTPLLGPLKIVIGAGPPHTFLIFPTGMVRHRHPDLYHYLH